MGACGSKQDASPKKSGLNTGKGKLQDSGSTAECKVVFLGDSAVGKSSISQRFCKNIFTGEHEVTIGGAYIQQKVQLKNGSFLKLHLWDTGGEERFRAMAPLYYRDANAAVLVYDVSNKQTFDSIRYWLNELDTKVKQDGLVLALAGNKCDLPESKRQVTLINAKSFAENNKMIFAETSAKTGDGITVLFQSLAEEITKKVSK
jgi:small GTP-binding protein